jgi:hypothetical protein
MSIEGRIDDLIEAGWGVVDSDFDQVAFQRWRRRAFECLAAAVGPDHVYTRQFERFVRQEGEADLLIASGILSAAKVQMAGNSLEPAKANVEETPDSVTERIGDPMKRRAIK